MAIIRVKSSLADEVRQLITGANKHFPGGSQPIQVGGETFTITGLTQKLQGFVDNREAVEALKAAARAKIEIERVQASSQLALVRAFKAVVRGTFGSSADVLADFGLAPPKVPVTKTAEQKAVAAAKGWPPARRGEPWARTRRRT